MTEFIIMLVTWLAILGIVYTAGSLIIGALSKLHSRRSRLDKRSRTIYVTRPSMNGHEDWFAGERPTFNWPERE